MDALNYFINKLLKLKTPLAGGVFILNRFIPKGAVMSLESMVRQSLKENGTSTNMAFAFALAWQALEVNSKENASLEVVK